MSTKNERDLGSSDDGSTDDTDDKYVWSESADGMTLARTHRYEEYELSYAPLGMSVVFDSIKETDDGEYALKDSHREKGTFSPNSEDVPENVATAFRVLAHEI